MNLDSSLPYRPYLRWDLRSPLRFSFNGLSEQEGLVHYFFTRLGGRSGPPFDSLNVGFSVGDDPANVKANLDIVQKAMGASRVVWVKQNHGVSAVLFSGARPWPAGGEPIADIIMTRDKNAALLVKLADCQGVVLYDPAGALALVHCGWRGNVADIFRVAVRAMQDAFGSNPKRLRAAIGPSLGPCCAEFVDYDRIFPKSFEKFMQRGAYFDLWALSRSQLAGAGLEEDSIECAGICTKCRKDLFFSYRGEGRTGRFCLAAMLL